MRSIGEVVLRSYNRTQTSFAQPTVFVTFYPQSLEFLYLFSICSVHIYLLDHVVNFFLGEGGTECISEEIFGLN